MVEALVGFPREVSGFAVFQSLQRRGIKVGTYDCHGGSAGLFSKNLFARYVWPDPELNEEEFIESLLRAGNKKNRPVLIDLASSTLEVINRHQEELRKRFRFVLPPSDIYDIALDKAKTAQFFSDHNLGAPGTLIVANGSDITKWTGDFPAVLKPRHGRGGRGQYVIHSIQQGQEFFAEHNISSNDYILQEWIPGPTQNLYNVGLLCAPGGKPRALFSGQKLDIVQTRKIAEGVASYTCSVRNAEILDIALKFAKLSGWAGMAELEFKRDENDGTYKIIEINPRIWAWIQHPISCGVDFPYLYHQIATSGDCKSVFSFDENVRYFRFILHFYTQMYRLFSKRIGLFQCISKIIDPYKAVLNPRQKVIFEDFKMRREYVHWFLYYLKDSYH